MSVCGRFVAYFILLMAFLYATQASDNIAHVGSFYGEVCYDSCDNRGGSYDYCHTKSGWDYCSSWLNVDNYGKTCKSGHPCGKHGYSYYWCYNSAGSWGYCGPVETKITRYRSSHYKKLCLDDCTYYDKGGYFYCITSTNREWDYCSPVPNVSYKNEMCNADDTCGLHGENYYWCKIGNSWEYCGLVEWKKCQKQYKASWKRVLLVKEVRNCIIDEDHNMEVNYILQTNNAIENAPELSRKICRSAHELIEQFSDRMLSPSPRTLVSNKKWRLDMQSTTKPDQNGQVFYNLQLQLNTRRRDAGHSTTYAAVLVPVRNAVNDNYTDQQRIRDALSTSLNESKLVTIEVRSYQPPRAML